VNVSRSSWKYKQFLDTRLRIAAPLTECISGDPDIASPRGASPLQGLERERSQGQRRNEQSGTQRFSEQLQRPHIP